MKQHFDCQLPSEMLHSRSDSFVKKLRNCQN